MSLPDLRVSQPPHGAPRQDLQVTVVHERFTEWAGSEQVVAQLARLWPDAPVLAPLARPQGFPADLERRIRPTALSRLLRGSGGYEHLLPVLPSAMRHLPVGEADVVVASHHAFADQVVHATRAPVVAYVHSPARWVWDPATRAGEKGGALGGAALSAFASSYRASDKRAAARLHTIVANSSAVAGRVREWWDQPATVVHPPVDTDHYSPDSSVPREDFLLLAGRLVPYKRPDLVVAAAKRTGRRLVVAGDGRMRAHVEHLAGPETTFLGRVTDDELRSLYRQCAALVMPGVEDFGIVPVEAQACGAPVLATGAGGALDSVVAGVTGEFVEATEPLEHGWAEALRTFDPTGYDSARIRSHSLEFSRAVFDRKMRALVEAAA